MKAPTEEVVTRLDGQVINLEYAVLLDGEIEYGPCTCVTALTPETLSTPWLPGQRNVSRALRPIVQIIDVWAPEWVAVRAYLEDDTGSLISPGAPRPGVFYLGASDAPTGLINFQLGEWTRDGFERMTGKRPAVATLTLRRADTHMPSEASRG